MSWLAPREAAVLYAARRWHVVPLWPTDMGRCTCWRGPTCDVAGRHPMMRWRESGGTSNRRLARSWWTQWPEAGVAILTGTMSGLFVVDVDPRHGGDETLAGLCNQHCPLPETLTAQTGGGGRHLYFKHPGGGVRQTAGVLGPGVDTRSTGGLVVAPPSLHRSGNRYEWMNWGTEPAELPGWLTDLLQPQEPERRPPRPKARASSGSSPQKPLGALREVEHGTNYAKAAVRGELVQVLGAGEGTRNDALNRAAFKLGQLVAAGALDEVEVVEVLVVAGVTVGLGEWEARDTVWSGLRAGMARPRG